LHERESKLRMLIRDYESGDRAALRECVVQLQAAEREIDPRTADGESIADAYIDYLRNICGANRGKILVAELNGQVVGYTAVQLWDNSEEVHEEPYEYGYVSDLVVLDAFRRRGLGRALLDAAQAYTKHQHIELLRIGVLAGNETVRRMYHGCGFREHKVVLEKGT
jgi:ribosomal protein S18 acetylase RimI-like enzyme